MVQKQNGTPRPTYLQRRGCTIVPLWLLIAAPESSLPLPFTSPCAACDDVRGDIVRSCVNKDNPLVAGRAPTTAPTVLFDLVERGIRCNTHLQRLEVLAGVDPQAPFIGETD